MVQSRQYSEGWSGVIVSDVAAADTEAVLRFWVSCGFVESEDDEPGRDLQAAIEAEEATVLLGRIADEICASVMVELEGRVGMVHYLGVDPSRRKQGLGRQMMDAAEHWVLDRGGRVLQLLVDADNLGALRFYEQIGLFRAPVITMAKRLDGRA